MIEVLVGILSLVVAVLAVLQGWQMFKHRNNPSGFGGKLDKVISELGNISAQLSKIEMRLDDIWNKVNK